ncbi:MAG: two-component system response regulator [Methylophilaceae bacterium 17-44-8]|nr:MAG: two-component system response regulator [Methylophilales bacterium 28-44-11]OYZ03259.1 MAG: two-component system response regulator [Methylophilales bacterium 16-45-7]OZA05991.1 MAG: two-component system response regulator [Methylophilaceae bacterium 17-44-8]
MKTALIIEDNDNNLELIRFILQQAGYRVRFAMTGLEGVQQALAIPPDFIVLDIQLPDINGLEVLKRIRANAIGATVPIIAMTSYAMSGDKERLLAAGCTSYIEKPIDPMTVIAQIEAVIGKDSTS